MAFSNWPPQNLDTTFEISVRTDYKSSLTGAKVLAMSYVKALGPKGWSCDTAAIGIGG